MKTILVFCMVIFTLLNSCVKNCPDEVSHSFTQTDLEFFSFEPNDTIHYKDKNSGELYYLTCVYKKITSRDSSFVSDDYCEHGGYWNIHDRMNFTLLSNLPHFNNKNAQINIDISAFENFESWVLFEFITRNLQDDDSGANVYRYYFSFDNKEVRIIKHPFWSINSEIWHYDSLVINGIVYSNVFSMNYDSINSGDSYKAVFDTIYYNENGFLKFISSQYGYKLERIN